MSGKPTLAKLEKVSAKKIRPIYTFLTPPEPQFQKEEIELYKKLEITRKLALQGFEEACKQLDEQTQTWKDAARKLKEHNELILQQPSGQDEDLKNFAKGSQAILRRRCSTGYTRQ